MNKNSMFIGGEFHERCVQKRQTGSVSSKTSTEMDPKSGSVEEKKIVNESNVRVNVEMPHVSTADVCL